MRNELRPAPVVTSVRCAEAVTALAWSPCGTLLACATASGDVLVVDQHGLPVRRLGGGEAGITALAWHPERRSLAIGDTDGRVYLWQAGTDSETTIPHRHWIGALAWERHTARLAVASGADLLVYGIDGKLHSEAPFLAGSISAAAWVKGPGTLVVATAGGLVWFRPEPGAALEPTATYEAPGAICSLSASPDGDRIATGDLAGALRITDLRSGDEVELMGYPDRLTLVGWTSDSTRVLVAADDELTAWEVGDGTNPNTDHPGSFVGDGTPVRALAAHPHRCSAATGHDGRTLCVWDLQDGTLVDSRDAAGPVLSCAWSPDGSLLAAGTLCGHVELAAP